MVSPTSRRVEMATDPSCATTGVCTDVYCTAGRIRDVCTADAQCNQPPDTCRLVMDWADISDTTLIFAKTLLGPIPGFMPVGVGCSGKVDAPRSRS